MGTYIYWQIQAPEVLLKKPYTVQADIYSLGVFLHYMIYGDFPYNISRGDILDS
jgi:serine/threonine protein kinase